MIRVMIALLVGAMLCGTAGATPPNRKPNPREYSSANGRFLLKVDPQKSRLAVYANPPAAEALWEFTYNVQFDRCVVSDDGESVVTMLAEYKRRNDGMALRFWNRHGEVKSYRIADLLWFSSNEGRVLNHWIIMKGPELFPEPETVSADEIQLITLEDRRLTFSLKTGELLHTGIVFSAWLWFFLKVAFFLLLPIFFAWGMYSLSRRLGRLLAGGTTHILDRRRRRALEAYDEIEDRP